MRIPGLTNPYRSLSLLLLTVLLYGCGAKDETESLYRYLDELIDNKELFDREKEQRIEQLKQLRTVPNLTPELEYEINAKIIEEYRKYQLDSAIRYTRLNLWIARRLNKPSLVAATQVELAPLYSYMGMYGESKEVLNSINTSLLSGETLADYYHNYVLLYYHYSSTSKQNRFWHISSAYQDSVYMFSNHSSIRYRTYIADQFRAEGNYEQAVEMFLEMVEEVGENSTHYAALHHSLCFIYDEMGDEENMVRHCLLSAIGDVRNSIKENASFMTLASICTENGDISRAFKYAHSAVEDATFANVLFRTSNASKFYSIINAAYQAQEADSKSLLKNYLFLISAFSVILILLTSFIYRQMKRSSRMRKELSDVNERLVKLNEILNSKNDQLSDSNLIKEQYIAQFFDLCSTYIDKMGDFRKSLNKLALERNFDQLYKKIKSNSLMESEIEELYKHFDTIFLGLYPTFVSDFNALLAKDEQIVLKSENQLNRELRIYALLRLGITDSARIASFLRCSISTVYNYRTKARNRAAASREDFENIVMTIGIAHKTED